MSWQTIELRGYAYYSEQGYRILVSLVHNQGYDFVAEKDGKFLRVNVKKAGLKNNKDPKSWAISKASGSATKDFSVKAEVDIYLVYLPHVDMFVELPGDFLDGGNSKSRHIPSEILKTALLKQHLHHPMLGPL